jgi:hypothetical protein
MAWLLFFTSYLASAVRETVRHIFNKIAEGSDCLILRPHPLLGEASHN